MFAPLRPLPHRARSRFSALALAGFALAVAAPAAAPARAGPPPPATLTVLPDIPGAIDTQVFGINNRGQVVGYYFDDADFNSHGFVYADGEYTFIDVPGALPRVRRGGPARRRRIDVVDDLNAPTRRPL